MIALFQLRACLLGAVLALACGCGGGLAGIQGTVTLDGTLIETGRISFVPIEGTAGSGGRAQIVKGHYSIDSAGGPSPGVYRIEILAPRKTGKKRPAGSPAPPGTMVDEEVEAIKSGLTKRVLDVLARLAQDEPEKYKTFWKEFGAVLKEGVAEDPANRDKLLPLLRFTSDHAWWTGHLRGGVF